MMSKQPVLTVDPSRQTKDLGDLFGVFFEDINHAADGGLYGELVRNRSFEFDAVDKEGYHALTAWRKVERGDAMSLIHVETAHPLNERNPHYLTVEVTRAGLGGGVMNEGYAGGMWVEAGRQYRFSCWYARQSAAAAPVSVTLETADGKVLTRPAAFVPESRAWTRCELTLRAEGTGAARLILLSRGVQTLCLDMVSLFPQDTFRGRENGLRQDVAQLIADMKPKFMRFPGGCLVHCGSLNADDRTSQYRWKNTLGAVEQRPARRNSWSYNQTLGLGYYELFCFCEDIGAQPLPILSAGWDPHTLRAAPLEDMQEWIDEALDLVEFANGGLETRWGAVRARMGHPAPFGLKYLGVGNEEVGDPFFERFAIIHQAVKARYPELRLIGTAGASCSGEVFEQGWEAARKAGSSYVDEHYYQSTTWLKANMHRYESYPDEQPRAFLGEYASRDDKYRNALVEAAYMTGMEKAPGLGLACYAPMLCHAGYINWKPDMIWFDNHRVYGTACYHVQKLFMNHQGDHEIFASLDAAQASAGEPIMADGQVVFHAVDPIEVTDVVITRADGDEAIRCDSFALGGGTEDHAVATIPWQRYALDFTAVRHNDADAEFPRALEVRFGIRDEGNYLRWIIDGWSQVSSLSAQIDGEYSDQEMYYAPAPCDQPVRYRLEVEDDTVRLYVNGHKRACAHNALPALDTLYYAASVEDATGDVIIKAVNLKTEAVNIRLDMPGLVGRSADVWRLEGYQPQDANSFDEPCKVCSVQSHVDTLPDALTLAPESVSVYRIHTK